DSLRRAVEHIRSQPIPQGSMQRALERASAIQVAPPRRWFSLRPEIQVRIAIAAAILVAIGIGFLANKLNEKSWNPGRGTVVALYDATSTLDREEDIARSDSRDGRLLDTVIIQGTPVDPATRRPAGINGTFANGSVPGIKQGVDPEVL